MESLAGLYLDTARLGRMTPSAQSAVRDFARLACEDPFTLYGPRLLREGYPALSTSQRRRWPGLSSWLGVAELKGALRRFVGSGDRTACALAHRSIHLAHAAARATASRCQRLLLVDLAWPPYAACFERAFRDRGKRAVMMSLRSSVLQSGARGSDIHELVCAKFAWHQCDAVFLPAVSHDGIRLPIDAICQTIRAMRPTALIVVDAAQSLAHVPSDLGAADADIILMGAHKWLGAGAPLGMALVVPNLASDLDSHRLDDSLTGLVEAIEKPTRRVSQETVNVWPLIACRGALAGLASSAQVAASLEVRLQNAAELQTRTASSQWRVIAGAPETRTGIVLLSEREHGGWGVMEWQDWLARQRVGLTVLPGPVLRCSMPDRPLTKRDWRRLITALDCTTETTLPPNGQS